MPFNLISMPGKPLKNVFKIKNKNSKMCNCDLCLMLPDKHHCRLINVVYLFTCKLCHAEYIGKTARIISDRFKEHKQSFQKKDNKSALTDHFFTDHKNSAINDFNAAFDFKILYIMKTPIECTIKESMLIEKLKPEINRKHEKSAL